MKIRPFTGDPQECEGYPSPVFWYREKPSHEINFLLDCDGDGDGDGDVKTKKTLACSLIDGTPPKKMNDKASIQEQLSKLDKSKPIIIVCHGMLSWRNQWFLANVASQLSTGLSYHVIRFDFTGNGHSSGPWVYVDYESDYRDLQKVEEFITSALELKIGCIIGHSQAVSAIFRHAYEHDTMDGYQPAYVNLAGRCFSADDFDPKQSFNDEQNEELEQKGSFTYTEKGPSKKFVVTMDAVQKRRNYDVVQYAEGAKYARILTIHGDRDQAVPVENAYKFDKLCHNHELHIVKYADHNFSGGHCVDEIVHHVSLLVRKQFSV